MYDYLNDFIEADCTDAIWGFHLNEEESYYHKVHSDDNCMGNHWLHPDYFTEVDIPVENIAGAIDFYSTYLDTNGLDGQHLIVMEANHHKSILDSTVDHENKLGGNNPQDYLKILDPSNPRHVFFEGSYIAFPASSW